MNRVPRPRPATSSTGHGANRPAGPGPGKGATQRASSPAVEPPPEPRPTFPSGNLAWRLVNPGDVVDGKYRVDSVLGTGGMGVVVAATHLVLGQPVALKVLHPWRMQGGLTVERFLREAQVAMRLRSEHVARVFDLGLLAEGAPYMVMELLDGSDLERAVEQHGPLPVAEAVDYVLQACDVLAEAHALGIVHRDLKPSNLFLTHRHDGSPLIKVLDFGIAKHTSSPSSLTATQCMLGSPRYSSPEQIRSARDVDARADIWSLGIVLYELLSGGKNPFDAETVEGTLARIIADPPLPLRPFAPHTPPELEAVVMACLAKPLDERPPSVHALAHALARCAGSLPPSLFAGSGLGIEAAEASEGPFAASGAGPQAASREGWMGETMDDPQAWLHTLGERSSALTLPGAPADQSAEPEPANQSAEPEPRQPSEPSEQKGPAQADENKEAPARQSAEPPHERETEDVEQPLALASSVAARRSAPTPGPQARRWRTSLVAAALLLAVAASWLAGRGKHTARGEPTAQGAQAPPSPADAPMPAARPTPEPAGHGQPDPAQAAPWQGATHTAKATATEQATTEQATTEQAATEQATTEPGAAVKTEQPAGTVPATADKRAPRQQAAAGPAPHADPAPGTQAEKRTPKGIPKGFKGAIESRH